MKPSIRHFCLLFPSTSTIQHVHLAQLAWKFKCMVLIQQHLHMGLSATQVAEARHRFTKRMTGKVEVFSISHFNTVPGTGKFLPWCKVLPSVQHTACIA